LATEIGQVGARIDIATQATEDILWVAEHHGGEAGQRLLSFMIAGPNTSMGELEVRLALGALATAQRGIIERIEELEPGTEARTGA
jgi:hypothetical protein